MGYVLDAAQCSKSLGNILFMQSEASDTTGKLLSSDAVTDPVQSAGSHRVGNCPFMVVTV
jgi:hypothetical protein